MSAPVLVVGAGPTGLLLAALLARAGIEVRVVEKETARLRGSRALAVFARSLEVLDDLGAAADILARGRVLRAARFHSGGRPLGRVDLSRPQTAMPPVLCVPQDVTEEVLERRAARFGVVVERGLALTGLRQTAGGVEAVLERSDGRKEECRCLWLVGCDGAHSTVRERAGFGWRGPDIRGLFLLADAEVAWSLAPDEFHAFFTPEGPLAVIPLPADGTWRIIAALPSGGPGPERLDAACFRRLVSERAGIETEVEEPSWASRFHLHQRIVGSYRRGRVLLAGDAAHAHSPVGGQGLNYGLQDAADLSWKLALVLEGRAGPGLLLSYQEERLPLARRLLLVTGAATRIVEARGPFLRGLRSALLSAASRLGPLRQAAVGALTGLDLHYRTSSIVRDEPSLPCRRVPWGGRAGPAAWIAFLRGPRAGDRAPDAQVVHGGRAVRLHGLLGGGRHTLLLFEGAGPAADLPAIEEIAHSARAVLGPDLRAFLVRATDAPRTMERGTDQLADPSGACRKRYGAATACLYVVRPDGYIGYRAQPPLPGGIERWARSWMPPAPPSGRDALESS